MDKTKAVFVISVAAELSGMHPQTLRQYDRLGIVTPDRTSGRGRRYSAQDIERLRTVQQLSQEEGVNLEGIRRIMAMEQQISELEKQISLLLAERDQAREEAALARRVFAAGMTGDVVAMRPGARPRPTAMSTALMVWRPTGS